MLLDVEGRTDTQPRGKGRWIETKCNNPGNRLAFTDLGLAPASTHQGAIVKHAVGDHSRKHVASPQEPEPRKTGKKTVEVKREADVPEIVRRQQGGYGLKKVAQAAPVPARERQRANATASETSEQRASKALAKAVAADPSLERSVAEARAVGGAALLEAERVLKRRQEQQQRAAFQAAAQAAQKPRRFADPANLATMAAPFGTNTDTSNTDFKPHKRLVPQPERDVDHVRGRRQVPSAVGSSLNARDIPYDTNDGHAPYPAPPECGVRVPAGTRHAKRVLEAPTDGRDYDSLSLQRAAHRASRDATGIPDFIFGSPPPNAARKVVTPCKHQPVGPALLEHNPHAAIDRKQPSRFSEVKYKKTALW